MKHNIGYIQRTQKGVFRINQAKDGCYVLVKQEKDNKWKVVLTTEDLNTIKACIGLHEEIGE